jgi:hypothetical protein
MKEWWRNYRRLLMATMNPKERHKLFPLYYYYYYYCYYYYYYYYCSFRILKILWQIWNRKMQICSLSVRNTFFFFFFFFYLFYFIFFFFNLISLNIFHETNTNMIFNQNIKSTKTKKKNGKTKNHMTSKTTWLDWW